MKTLKYTIIALLGLGLSTACADLDLNPLSAASSENWYQNAEQITISLNDLYRLYPYGVDNEYWTDRRTDDWAQRDQVYDLCNGSNTSATGIYGSFWLNMYKAASRSIRVIESIDKLGDPDNLQTLKAEAYFFRAYFYGKLTTLWGDVPFYTRTISYEEAYDMGQTDKAVVRAQVYEDFDKAIEGLPASNIQNDVWRVTRGAAQAMKAKYAIWWGDYETCAKLTKDIIDEGTYKLYYDSKDPADSYGCLARSKTFNEEFIFALGRSYALDADNTEAIKSWVLRTAGGNAVAQPSWDLLAAYECTDGKTINDSPLFDCHNPFENRDPRCCMTFVKPGTTIYGVEFNPSTTAKTVLKDGVEVKNKDTKANDNYAPYNGCCIRKGVQDEWRSGLYNENPIVLCRYADVLLMYAESKMELNQIDKSVLNAINSVRARAYGVQLAETSSYPAVTTTDQAELRKVIRRERRVELAWEGQRLYDLRRWGLLEKAYSVHYYGFLNSTGLTAYEKAGNWFWPEIPMLDEDGFADFETMYKKGYIERYGFHVYDSKVELFPVPDEEILINKNLVQNPGY